MASHLSALLQTLLLYLIIGVAYFGWGSMVMQVLGGIRRPIDPVDVTLIWLGWAFTLFLFQLLHFRFALSVYIVVPIFALGIAFSIPHLLRGLRHRFRERPAWGKYIGGLILMLVVAGWIASKSMITPINYDSGLYHFNAVRWINEFPLVPGLGNLHGRLAFNHSFFTWVATLNFFPWLNHGRSVANSFLFLLTLVTFARLLLPVVKQPSLLTRSHPFQYAPSLFALPILGYLAFFSDGLPAPSPDLASTLLQLSLFVMFAQDLVEWIEGKELKSHRAFAIVFLCATAITIKLSNLVFSAILIGIYLVRTWQAFHVRGVVRIVLPVAAAVLVWIGRGYVLSGAPLYPSTLGYISTEWSVPRQKVAEEANWVYSWARHSDRLLPNLMGNWDWFQPWKSWVVHESQAVLVYPLLLVLVFGILTGILVFMFKKKTQLRSLDLVLLFPLAPGLVYWFFTAPDPRFAHALFWCLAIGSALLLLDAVQPLLKKRWFIGILCIVFLMTNLRLIGSMVENFQSLSAISTSGWQPVKARPLARKETASGLRVYIPKRTDQCWDAPLPCTPYFNRDLRLRTPGQLGSGFTVTLPEENARQQNEGDE